jgi:hypothetical protein
MKRIVIDQTQLLRAVAQLTHVDVDPAEWGWIVAFDPAQADPLAEVQLPDRINSQGGVQPPHRASGRDEPESATPLPEPVMVSPLNFVDLEPGFKWNGEIPDMADPGSWPGSAMQDAVDQIRSRLRQQVEIDGERYTVAYR